jgi:signal transduction histidine kinase
LQPLDTLGPIGETARTGQPIWLATNAEIFGRYPQLGNIPARRRYGAAVSVPLQLGGQTLGVMSLRYPDERPYNADDLGLIMAIGGQCAQALERARLFDAERAARADAEDAVRARDEFLSIASHELRTPVAALKGTAQLLLRRMLRGEADAERIERALHIIDETADRLTVLTADLLDVARLRSGRLTLDPQPLDLVALVRDALEREHEQRGDEYARELTLDAPEQLPPVLADATRIDQVLANLLDNALKYSPAGQPVRVSVQPDAAGLRVSISDAGIGLPPGTHESIFEPFGRAANAAASSLPGLGLGLYISRNIIEQHGGRVWAESGGEGLGATFHVWLPAVE